MFKKKDVNWAREFEKSIRNSILIYVDKRIRQLEKQLQCATKGHDFVFDFVFNEKEYFFNEFRFKCKNCGLTILKTKDELTIKEKKALKDLGILEENNGKTKMAI